ncbi:hypothetical protein FA09DRAFT_206066 [Tilletiopsis washingtonensis]|jgi:hypothetical protein|uniref:Uncharacterized protein n=1 Tax=Tilletiopsis washingtonensis TaxID=58919 RepID=A0A316ZGG4_9BASI|nr:hypothetical protein FA09DRAFT_206066 [Tilletiopsis washingtonensis]PWO00105.1 hypothetical protein FA09DRAFT_206066 [Tilletiopsis washingtonensis]
MLLRRRRRGVSRLTRRDRASPLKPSLRACVGVLQRVGSAQHRRVMPCLREPARDAQGVLVRFGVGTGQGSALLASSRRSHELAERRRLAEQRSVWEQYLAWEVTS